MEENNVIWEKILFFKYQSTPRSEHIQQFSSLLLYQTMLVKHIKQKMPLLRNALSFTTASQIHQSNEPDETKPSKHNPKALKDLRGHNNIDQLTQSEQAMSPIHSKQYHYSSASHFCSLLSNKTARFIGSLTESPKLALASDCLNLPRIVAGSVPLYDSIEGGSNQMVKNKLIFGLSPLLIAVFSPMPTLTLAFYGLSLAVYNHFYWRAAKHLVLKSELLPQTEEIVYQKVGLLGGVVTRTVKISQLQHVRLQEEWGENDGSERAVRGLINKETAFKVKNTSEYLVFEKGGFWHEAGLNHELLV